jgi:hypothetical protein
MRGTPLAGYDSGMRRLLVICDLFLDPAEIGAGAQARLPQMPALTELLHLGKPGSRHEDWRAGLAADLGVPGLAHFAPAKVAACATELAPASAVCMAEPVHLVAGMASVHLHPAGLLQLDPDSMAQLQHQFAREFGARDQALIAVGDGMLLAAPEAAAANAGEPARALGNPVEASRSADVTGRALRRLGAEVEMWLPGLALNRDRERRGELPVTTLWFWGGGKGALPEVEFPGAPNWEQAYGGDPWVHGIWRKRVNANVRAARTWDDVKHESALVTVSAVRGVLEQLEADWFSPALRDLQGGRVTALAIRIGGQRWELGAQTGSRWWARWRRPRPWWQVLAA